jgi:hypothetical protein
MHDHNNANPNGPQTGALEHGQAHWGKAAASPEACLVSQDQAGRLDREVHRRSAAGTRPQAQRGHIFRLAGIPGRLRSYVGSEWS